MDTGSDGLMITVKFFASLREAVGHDHVTLDADTLPRLRSALAERLSKEAQQALWADGVRLAINQQFLASVGGPAMTALARVQRLPFCRR